MIFELRFHRRANASWRDLAHWRLEGPCSLADGYGLVGYIAAVRIYIHIQNDAIPRFINTDQTDETYERE